MIVEFFKVLGLSDCGILQKVFAVGIFASSRIADLSFPCPSSRLFMIVLSFQVAALFLETFLWD